MKKVAVIGLGYVGLTTALLFANTGMDVLCIDEDEDKVKLLKKYLDFNYNDFNKHIVKIINYLLSICILLMIISGPICRLLFNTNNFIIAVSIDSPPLTKSNSDKSIFVISSASG